MNPTRKARIFFVAGAVLLLLAGGRHADLVARRGADNLQEVPPEQTTPLVTLTTVAFGAFRGLAANALWMRAAELQENGQFFELVQLSAWISQLEPNTPEVWEFQAWNLAYNLSVLFPNPEDRWRWVSHGLDLLRDEGLRHNPTSALLHWNVGWMFQHKIGMDFDQAHFHYKTRLAQQVEEALGGPRPTREGWEQAVRATFHMDPALMLELEKTYGPLDWRIPDTHLLYWAVRGEPLARDTFRARSLRRMRLQALMGIMRRGDVLTDAEGIPMTGLPRFELLDTLLSEHAAMRAESPTNEATRRAMRTFLADTTLLLSAYHKFGEAQEFFDQLAALDVNIPAGPDGLRTFVHANTTALETEEMNRDQAMGRITSLLVLARRYDASDPPRARGLRSMASQVHRRYQASRLGEDHMARTGLPPFEALDQAIRSRLEPGHLF